MSAPRGRSRPSTPDEQVSNHSAAGRVAMRMAVMGAGSLGIVVGGLMTRSGQDVVLIDVDQENVDALNAGGARIAGSLEVTIPVRAIQPRQMSGTYDVVILRTKQTNNAAALPAILPHLGPESTVCTLQNGIPEDFRRVLRRGHSRDWRNRGFWGDLARARGYDIDLNFEALQNFAFDVGEVDGRTTPRLKEIRAALSSVGGCRIVCNSMPIRWSKLLMNATFSGVSTALGCLFGDVLESRQRCGSSPTSQMRQSKRPMPTVTALPKCKGRTWNSSSFILETCWTQRCRSTGESGRVTPS